jgi:hypothetical protein
LGAKYLFLLCAGFTLLLGEEAPTHQQVVWRHPECRKASKHHLLKFGSLLLDDYHGFITEGKLATVLITPSLGIPNWSAIYIISTAPSPVGFFDLHGRLWVRDGGKI